LSEAEIVKPSVSRTESGVAWLRAVLLVSVAALAWGLAACSDQDASATAGAPSVPVTSYGGSVPVGTGLANTPVTAGGQNRQGTPTSRP
jgi:hypothetical protein